MLTHSPSKNKPLRLITFLNSSHNLYAYGGRRLFKNLSRRQRVGTPTEASGLIL